MQVHRGSDELTLFQRFMRVLTHPQHSGKPVPAKKAKAPKAARNAAKPVSKPKATPQMKVAGKPQPPSKGTAMRAASNAGGATAVAERPGGEARMPTSPSKPVEVFSPDRPANQNGKGDKPESQARSQGNADFSNGSLLDDMDDSTLGLIHPTDADRDEAPANGQSKAKADSSHEPAAIEKIPDSSASKGPEIGEVVDLIEKLRTHVDAQGGRFDQAMGVLDQIRESAAALPEIRERIDTMLASIDELKANQFKGHEKVERALSAQSSRLDEIFKAIERATQREEKLAQSLTEINQTILAVSGTNDRLAAAIDAMRRHEAERDARIGRALTGAQRWLIVLTLVMGVGMIATIITAMVAGG